MREPSVGPSWVESWMSRSYAHSGVCDCSSTLYTALKLPRLKPLARLMSNDSPPPSLVVPMRMSMVVPSAFFFRMKLTTPAIASEP